MRFRRALFRLIEIFDYRTFIAAGVIGALVLVGYLVVASAQTVHEALRSGQEALRSQQQSRAAASRRIDLLQRVVARQADTIARNAEEIGSLNQGQRALSEQVRQLGGRPVITPAPVTRHSAGSGDEPQMPASPSAGSPRPFSPAPSPSRTPRRTPSPSPTCTRPPVPVLGCR